MMYSWENVCVWLLTLLADGTLLYAFSCAALRQRPSIRHLCIYMLSLTAVDTISMFCFDGGFSGWSLLQSLLHIFIAAKFIFRLRRRGLVVGILTLLSIHLLLSLLAGTVSILLLGTERVNDLMLTWTWPRLWLALTHLLLFALLPAAYLLQRLRKRSARTLPDWLYIARSVLLLLVTVFCIATLFNHLPSLAVSSRLTRVIFLFSITALMLIICFSYLAQDIRFLRMRKHKETLEQQKHINDALVADLRRFRGQVIQMVDRLGGILSEGSQEQKRAYYDQTARQCAQINNDNVLALQRITDTALSALLLRKLSRCRELMLPIYLHLFGHPCFDKTLSPILCEITGVLLDNAIEAAADSIYPRVVVQLTELAKGVEINIMNTFPETMDVNGFLDGNTASTKEGHTGEGLRSVTALCQKHANLSVQYTMRGRFIVCSLMIL